MAGGLLTRGFGARTVLLMGAVLLCLGARGQDSASGPTVSETAGRWSKIAGGTGIKSAYFMQETPDGGAVYSGGTNVYGAAGADYMLFKLDGSGAPVWSQLYGTPQDEVGFARPTSDGGYIVEGATAISASSATNWLMKLDSTGAIVWQKNLASANPASLAVIITSVQGVSDGYILSAFGIDTTSFSAVTLLVKTDLSGGILWQKSYGVSGYSLIAPAVLPLSDGSLMVYGTLANSGTGDTDLVVMKLSSAGAVTWSKSYGGPLTEGGVIGLTLRADGGFLLQGGTRSWGMGGAIYGDLWILKLDSSGNILWQNAYGGAADEFGMAVSDPSGGYFVAATTNSFGAGQNDLWAFKLDEAGSIVWQETLGGAGDDDMAIQPEASATAGYLLSGTTSSFGGGGKDVWVVALNGSGSLAWQKTYGTAKDEQGWAYRLPSGDITIYGTSALPSPPDPTDNDAWFLHASPNGDLGTACDFIHAGTGVVGTATGVATPTTATPVSVAVTVGTPTFTATAGALASKAFTLPLVDLCSGGSSCSLSCTATVPSTGSMGQPVSFAATATPSTCTGTPTYDWEFGDGTEHSTSQNPSHAYASEGTFHWQVTASLNGATCTEEGSITVTQAQVVPPVVSLMKKVAPPFTIVATGSGFQSGVKVYINGAQWPSVLWKNAGKIKLTGSSLKVAVPKGVATEFRFVNPDGGETTKTWNW